MNRQVRIPAFRAASRGVCPRLRPAVVAGLAFWAALSANCYGSAFSIMELGARATSMGTAFIAVADDGTAIFYNPAGIAFIPGRVMQMETLAVVGLFRYTPSSTPVGQDVPSNGYSGSVRPHVISLANLYATQQYNDRITFGFGVFTPFGLAANFTNFNDADPNLTKFVGRFAGTRVGLQEFWFQPTISYKITPNSAIAIGPALVHTHLFLEKSFLNPLDDGLDFGRQAASTIFPGVDKNQAAAVLARLLPEGRLRLAGTSNSPGLAAGWIYKNPRSKTSFGLMFRSAVVNHLNGKASFAFGSDYTLKQYIGSDFLFNAFPNQYIKGSLTTPATYGVGIANSKLRNTTLAFDVRLQDYTRFSSVPLNFGINSANHAKVALPPEQRLFFGFHDSVHVAVGMERILNAATSIRLGYSFDYSPVPDESVGPLFPDSNRHYFTVGATRKVGDAEFSFFYEAAKFQDRVTNVAANANNWTNGDYHNFAHLMGLSLRFNKREAVIRH